MTEARRYDEKGDLIEVQENGETVEKFRPIDGEKISEESRENLRKEASTPFEKKVYEILTGESI